MTLYLIRHGHAGSRKEWTGDDDERPLSDKGWAQAEGIAERFAGAGIVQVRSSPSLRCVQTVEPLAGRLGLEVQHDKALREGASRRSGLDLLEQLADRDVALCSHGDVIPELIRALHKRDVGGDGVTASAKGGTFLLDTADGRVVATRYLPPPA